MTTKEIVARISEDLKQGKIKVVSSDGYRYYTDTLSETLNVPITTTAETAEMYYKLVIDNQQPTNAVDLFDSLPRVSMYVGQPDTGKTYKAFDIAKQCGIDPILLMCREDLNLETLVEDFTLVEGKPVFQESLPLKAMTGTDKAIIILDEFNTLRTGVSKTFQPIFDNTSPTFVYKGKIYNKNLNCKFIVTLNDKDKGISIVPDAILSRSRIEYFKPTDLTTLAKWTGKDVTWITVLHKIYKVLGALNIFGTRQINMLHGSTIDDIKNHLYGICTMKNIDAKVVESLEIQTLIAKL